MLTAITHHALDYPAGFDNASRRRVATDLGAELVGLLQRVFERDIDVVGNELREAIGLDKGQVANAGQVADDHLGTECAEGDDVGDAVGAVFLPDVIDDLVATAHAEVDIEVGCGDAFGIKETLEQ